VVEAGNGKVLVERARWCDTFASKTRGFTFRRELAAGEGLVLVDSADSRLNSGITMLFCFLDLGVLWVNGAGQIVDTIIAKPWRPSYLPQAPARYVIEAEPEIVRRVKVGDYVSFVDPSDVR